MHGHHLLAVVMHTDSSLGQQPTVWLRGNSSPTVSGCLPDAGLRHDIASNRNATLCAPVLIATESNAANIFLNFGNFPQNNPIMVKPVVYYTLSGTNECAQPKNMLTFDEWEHVNTPSFSGHRLTGVKKCALGYGQPLHSL